MFTANGSACSQLIGAPQDDGRTFSGRLSGTATNMKKTSSTAMAVARATTRVSLYISISAAPRAGEITLKLKNSELNKIYFEKLIQCMGIIFKMSEIMKIFLRTKLAAKVADTKPYARDLSSTVVTSAT